MYPRRKPNHETPASPAETVGDVRTSSGFFRGVFKNLYAITHAVRIQKENEQLRYESSHDKLTGALNQQAFWAEAEGRTKLNKPFVLVVLDIDRFKDVNDTLGHRIGDELLRFLGQKFRREGDVLGRLGGDEFGLILRADDRSVNDGLIPQQRRVAELKYVDGVIKECIDQQNEGVRATGFGVSRGDALWNPDSSDRPRDVDELRDKADQAMYLDKAAKGRPAR